MAIPETEGPTQSVGVCVSLSLGFFLFFCIFSSASADSFYRWKTDGEWGGGWSGHPDV